MFQLSPVFRRKLRRPFMDSKYAAPLIVQVSELALAMMPLKRYVKRLTIDLALGIYFRQQVLHEVRKNLRTHN